MTSWSEQLEDMEKEDTYHGHLLSNKVYPNGLFNLTSNPIFNLYNERRRIKAIVNILEHDDRINRRSILYDRHNHVVFSLQKIAYSTRWTCTRGRCGSWVAVGDDGVMRGAIIRLPLHCHLLLHHDLAPIEFASSFNQSGQDATQRVGHEIHNIYHNIYR